MRWLNRTFLISGGLAVLFAGIATMLFARVRRSA